MAELSLVIITGLSGAGKSTALSRLEDSGYYCVDNLPSPLLSGFIEQCRAASIKRAAVGVDARESAFGFTGAPVWEGLKKLGVDYRILFLDCADEVLKRRYIETRRRHPFADVSGQMHTGIAEGTAAGTALGTAEGTAAGIARERALLQPLREGAHIVIDTSALTPRMLVKRLDEAILNAMAHSFRVLVTSFGYKRGIPMDADIVLDTRFFPNPFYISALRPLSGLDAAVRDFVLNDPQAAPYFDAVEKMLLSSLPGLFAEGKQRVMAAFGCTGGRHRSVAAAEEVRRRLSNAYAVHCFHRDLTLEADDITIRFNQ